MVSTRRPERDVCLVILAGGRSLRFHGRNKARIAVAGRPMIQRVIDTWAGNVAEMVISSRAGLDYADLGCPVIADAAARSEGPLAGIARAFDHARHPYVLTVPCDMPHLPAAVLSRLRAGLEESGSDAAVARHALCLQPLVALYRNRAGACLQRFLAGPQRSVQAWQRTLHHVVVDISAPAKAFLNVNSPADLAGAEDMTPSLRKTL